MFDLVVEKSPQLGEELLNLRLESNHDEDYPAAKERDKDQNIELKIDLSLFRKPGTPLLASSPLKSVEEPQGSKCKKLSREPEMVSLMHMLTEDHRELIRHPVSETFLHLKWQRLRCFFYLGLAYQFLFSMVVTVLSVVSVKEAKHWNCLLYTSPSPRD